MLLRCNEKAFLTSEEFNKGNISSPEELIQGKKEIILNEKAKFNAEVHLKAFLHEVSHNKPDLVMESARRGRNLSPPHKRM